MFTLKRTSHGGMYGQISECLFFWPRDLDLETLKSSSGNENDTNQVRCCNAASSNTTDSLPLYPMGI